MVFIELKRKKKRQMQKGPVEEFGVAFILEVAFAKCSRPMSF